MRNGCRPTENQQHTPLWDDSQSQGFEGSIPFCNVPSIALRGYRRSFPRLSFALETLPTQMTPNAPKSTRSAEMNAPKTKELAGNHSILDWPVVPVAVGSNPTHRRRGGALKNVRSHHQHALSAVLSARGPSLICFPQFSGVLSVPVLA